MDYVRQPWAHQLEAIRRQSLLDQIDPQSASFGLFFEPGTGKTGTAINIWRKRCNIQKKILRTLIFCPPIVVPQWKKEFLLNSRTPPERIVLLQGPGKRRLDLFHRYAWKEVGVGFEHERVIFVTNYESLLMPELFMEMKKWTPDAIVYDECHELKNYKAKRSKLAEDLSNWGKQIPFKQILSGTPLLKDPMDLFQQFLILDGGQTFGKNFFVFQSRYFRDRNAGMPKQKYFPKWELMTLEKDGFDAEAAISAAMAHKAMSVKKADCMDLPPFIQTTIEVEMSPDQRRMYDEMKRDFVTYMEEAAVVATMAMTKALRLQQIASGYVKTHTQEEIAIEATPKMEALEQLVANITGAGQKVLIWAVWKNNYAQIRAVLNKLGVKYVEIHGEVSEAAKHRAVEAFNNDPSVGACIGHPGSGGVGVNLVSAAYSVFYSRTFSLKEHVQAEARNYRGGSEIHEKITRYDLVCKDSIDELVLKKLANKIELSDSLLRDLALELHDKT